MYLLFRQGKWDTRWVIDTLEHMLSCKKASQVTIVTSYCRLLCVFLIRVSMLLIVVIDSLQTCDVKNQECARKTCDKNLQSYNLLTLRLL